MSDESVQKKSLSDIYGTCKTCGATFKKFKSNHMYCCYDCLREHYRNSRPYIPKETEIKICKHCGKEFLSNDGKRHYCSPECYEDHRGHFYTKVESRTVVCEWCKTKFKTTHGTKKYCSLVCYRSANAAKQTERKKHERQD